MVNLMVQFGDSRVSYDELGIPAMPEKTDSYCPVSHRLVVDMVKQHIHASGRSIVQEQYGLAQKGQKMFGLLEVETNSQESAYVVAVRNSYNKTLPVGLAAGSTVRVCSNGIFAGEVVSFRKHTTFIMRDLPAFLISAMGRLAEQWAEHDRRIALYKDCGFSDMQAHDMISRLYLGGGISKTLVADALDQWHRPAHDFGSKTLWRLHNALTEVIKGRQDLMARRSQIIHATFDPIVGLLANSAIEAEIV